MPANLCHQPVEALWSRAVTILSDRWRGFRRIPHIAIAELPTPVEPMASLSERMGAELWIKRDDLTSRRYGGNKTRKLEYILGEAVSQGADTLVTTGAAGSHHALASAIFAADLRMRVDVVSFAQPSSAHAEAQLRALLHAGAHVHPTRSPIAAPARMQGLAATLRVRGRQPLVVPPGGSSLAGTIGHVEAGLELARQIESRVLPEPDAIFMPLGSGGTLAGMAVGLAAAGITSELIGARVVPMAVANRVTIQTLISRTVRHLRELDERFPDVAGTAREHVTIDGEEFGPGYGVSTPVGRAAMRLAREHASVELDPTYSAKAFAAMLRHAAGARAGQQLLFIQTLSAAHPGGDGPRLPKNLRRLLKR